jgi:nucleotide-binding universal stress UspA family protein
MQVRRVLAAVSLHTPSPKAVLAGAELAAAAGAELTVLTVLRDPWELVRADEVEGFRRLHQGSPASLAVARATERLQALAGPAALAAPAVSYEVAFGWPSIEIARHAERIGADVIAMGKGDEVTRNTTENVTAATLRRSRVPVLVAPARHRVYRRVLTCVDDSPQAPLVLEVAQTIGGCFGARVVALHVEPSDANGMAPGKRRPWLQRLEHSEGTGGTIAAPCETLVRQGDAASEILAETATEDADLIAFGFRRGMNYSDAGATMSVGSRLLRRASCALLAVPV